MKIRYSLPLFAAFAPAAFASISPVTQERSVQTLASVTSGGSSSDFAEATSFAPFVRTITSTISGAAGAGADATASQDSAFTDTSITGSFAAHSAARTGTTFDVGESDAQSNYLFIFNLTAATTINFTANGQLAFVGQNPDGEPSDLYGRASVRLLNGVTEELIAGFTLFPEAGTDSATFSGTLPAGQYVILAAARTYAYSADLLGPPLRSGSGDAHVSFALNVAAPCPADYNQDGGIDGGDVQAFFADWEAGEGRADVNQDGGIDGGDVGTFFMAWEHGGC